LGHIELKRQRVRLRNGKLGASPSKVSPEQLEWIKELDDIDNVSASLCFGWEEARDKVLEWEAL